MREFYKERDVVFEERRMRVDSNPIGRLLEQFQSALSQRILMAFRESAGPLTCIPFRPPTLARSLTSITFRPI